MTNHFRLGSLLLWLLLANEFFLSIQAPSVTSELSVFSNDAMTRHDDSDWVCRAGVADGSCGCGFVDRLGDFAVSFGASVGNLAQLLPDHPLEGGRLDVEWKVENRLLSREMAEKFLQPAFQIGIVACQFGFGKLVGKDRHEFCFRIAQTHHARTFLGSGQEYEPDFGFPDCVTDRHVLSPTFVGSWSHAEVFGSTLVQAAGRAVSSIEQRRRNCARRLQSGFQSFETARVDVLFGSDTQDMFERSLDIARTQIDVVAESGQGDVFFQVTLDVLADLFNDRSLAHAGFCVWHHSNSR